MTLEPPSGSSVFGGVLRYRPQVWYDSDYSMFAPTAAEILNRFHDVARIEPVIARLMTVCDVVAEKDRLEAILRQEISTVAAEMKLEPEQARTLEALVSSERLDPGEGASVVRQRKRFGDPGIESVVSGIPSLLKCDRTGAQELLTGKIFRALDGQRPWSHCSDLIGDHFEIAAPTRADSLVTVKLTKLGEEVAALVDEYGRRGQAELAQILNSRGAPDFVKRLAARYDPACVVRPVSGSDAAGPFRTVDRSSHILRQAVVTQAEFDGDRSDAPVYVKRSKIYIADLQDPEIFPALCHELIELAVIDDLLARLPPASPPARFTVQYLAELSYTDAIVWSVQVRTADGSLSRDEEITLLGRAFQRWLAMEEKFLPKCENLLGSDHPICREMRFYADVFAGRLQGVAKNKLRPAMKRPSDRTSGEQKMYGEALSSLFQDLFNRLSRHPKANEVAAIVARPEQLLEARRT